MAELMQEKKTKDGGSVVDLLLAAKLPNLMNVDELPTGDYEIPRLSKLLFGEPDKDADEDEREKVVFHLRALPYGRVQELKRFDSGNLEINILLEGCVSPDLTDQRFVERFGGAVASEMVQRILLPGEITDLSNAIEQLTGYRRLTIAEVKNA